MQENTSIANDMKQKNDRANCVYVYSLSSRTKSKYYVAAKLDDECVVTFLDSGADISLVPENLVRKNQCKSISNPFDLKGFDDNVHQTINKCTELTLNFGNKVIKGKFFVCKTKFIIIGCDILRDSSQKVNLETKNGKLTIDGQVIMTDHTPFEALSSLKNRISISEYENASISRNWVHLRTKVNIPPFTTTAMRLERRFWDK